MAFQHGKSTVFKLDNSAGSLVDLSAYLNTVSLPFSVDSHETTTFGQTDKTYLAGLGDATISIGGPWDLTLDGHMIGVRNALKAATLASASFLFQPQGAGTGKVEYTGEIAVVTGYNVDDPVGDLVTWTADLQVTGSVTRTIQP
jgi:hypothetical protein